jgi:hypothetical protein
MNEFEGSNLGVVARVKAKKKAHKSWGSTKSKVEALIWVSLLELLLGEKAGNL